MARTKMLAAVLCTKMLAAVLCTVSMSIISTATPSGPFKTAHKSFTVKELDLTNRALDVVYPDGADGWSGPVIAYAHGLSDGGSNVMDRYTDLFEELASYGYVVVAPRSCSFGCLGDCQNHPLDPPCFANFYHQQLLAIDWARSPAAAELPINATAGVGVAGHSMGGQSSVFAAAYNASAHNIKAAAMHHAFTHTFPPVQVPHLVFTGTEDTTAPPKMAEKIFNTAGAFHTRALVNKVGATHSEPDRLAYNPKLALYTVAWFKLYIDGTPQWRGTDFDSMIHGNNSDSLCGGGDGAMEECSVLR